MGMWTILWFYVAPFRKPSAMGFALLGSLALLCPGVLTAMVWPLVARSPTTIVLAFLGATVLVLAAGAVGSAASHRPSLTHRSFMSPDRKVIFRVVGHTIRSSARADAVTWELDGLCRSMTRTAGSGIDFVASLVPALGSLADAQDAAVRMTAAHADLAQRYLKLDSQLIELGQGRPRGVALYRPRLSDRLRLSESQRESR